jgi:glycosyltransferase involved in cell wall biosynthesis
VHPPSVPYLADAYESLASQEMPAGWAWQWVVQEDGRTGAASAVLPKDPRISAGTGRKGGAGTTRNMALARAEGSLVRVLDADDRLTPGALAREIEAFTRSPSLGWTTASALDLLPDGSTIGRAHADPPEGRLTRTFVLSYFQQHNYRLPIHPATLCIRRELALALGGWMALPAGEDTGLLLAASVTADGYFIGTPGLLYRKHLDQITGQADWTKPSEWLPRMRLIEARALALRRLWEQR